jgi:hypothetical protein
VGIGSPRKEVYPLTDTPPARRRPSALEYACGESEGSATTMTRTMEERKSSQWTSEERAREERARAVRTRQDQAKTPAERLEETLGLSRLMSELQRDAASDVPGR